MVKILLPCSKCFPNEGIEIGDISINEVDIRDDGQYTITCPKGHQTTTILHNLKYEILFQIGAYAILDGYYREAVSSFSSCLERFYEFCIYVLMTTQKNSYDLIERVWNRISAQSERQLGAFIFLWTSIFKEEPLILPRKQIEFRNAVVHKGKIPNRKESEEYGSIIYQQIITLTDKMREDYLDEIRSTKMNIIYRSVGNQAYHKRTSSLFAATILDPSFTERSKVHTFKEILDLLKERSIFKSAQ